MNHAGGYAERLRLLLGRLLGRSGPISSLGLALCIGGCVAAAFFVIFAELAEELWEEELVLYDTVITNWISSFTSPGVTASMKFVSDAGGNWVVLGLLSCIVSYFLYQQKKHYWDAMIVQFCLWGGYGITQALKLGFKRQRPTLQRLVEASGFSFPSGHSMVSFAFYGMLIYIAYANLPRSAMRTTIVWFIAVFICLVGISRIYLGVHYPSDVAAGFAAGGIWLIVCIFALETVQYYKGDAP
jgi:undecaprenyl-diphosphatase